MRDALYNYLEQFMIQSNWADENTPEQARAIFTTLCFMCNIDADTKECDDILFALHWKSDLCSLDIKYEEFESFMLKLIV